MEPLNSISNDSILDRLPAGFIVFSDDGTITTVNRTLADLLSFTKSELEGQSIQKLLTVGGRIFYHTHLFPLLQGKLLVEEVYLPIVGKDGIEVPMLVNGRRTLLNGEHVNECLFTPVKNRDQYENEILAAKRFAEEYSEELHLKNAAVEEHNKELQTLQESLRARLNAQTAELEMRVNELKSYNLTISHNMRAPLRAILFTSSQLQGSPESDQAEMMERQQINVATLSSMIDNLLDLSRLSLQSPAPQQVDLSRLAESAAHSAVNKAPAGAFEVHVEPGISAWADLSMMRILFDCLMSNAVKYSPRGGRISFHGNEKDGTVLCLVKDEGIGMDPAYFHHIFQPFERLHRESDFPGNGIGLSLVERVVHHHGGKVWVESEVAKGAAIYFTLPAHDPSKHPVATSTR